MFLQEPPTPAPPALRQPQQREQPSDDDEDPLHPKLRPHPLPVEKADAPRFGG
jgi:hypothetical protein